jgi:hypothetical protein
MFLSIGAVAPACVWARPGTSAWAGTRPIDNQASVEPVPASISRLVMDILAALVMFDRRQLKRDWTVQV